MQSCHARVTFISHRDAELTLLVLCRSWAICVLCPDSRPEGLRKTKTPLPHRTPQFGFHTLVPLTAACFAKFGHVRP